MHFGIDFWGFWWILDSPGVVRNPGIAEKFVPWKQTRIIKNMHSAWAGGHFVPSELVAQNNLSFYIFLVTKMGLLRTQQFL
jgi:hypothetical protein